MLAAFSITPLGVGEATADQIAEAIRIVRASGLPSETNAMFTNVEGDWDEVIPLIRTCVDRVAQVAPRVTVTIKLDYRPGEPNGRLRRDVESIEQRLR